ncbi:MAG: pyridoxine 5'-phosphate synthase [Candidatus Omnitrophica bacterium]|nr:pyridoxine 5'-phosphate synthase [Candidatus Omnitrophota bacterium]
MRLGVNIDHIASIRQLRGGPEPEPVFAALIAQNAGSDSIVVHLREDRRHIKERDLFLLKEVVKIKLNLEMSIAPDIVEFALRLKPNRATLVPERRQEMTTEGGVDVRKDFKAIKKAAKKLNQNDIPVSLFIDPDKAQINHALEIPVKMVELHTGRYANAKTEEQKERALQQIKTVARYAKTKGFFVFAGHGLDYFNVDAIAKIEEIEELNIGYSIICRAAIVGLEEAILQMKHLING